MIDMTQVPNFQPTAGGIENPGGLGPGNYNDPNAGLQPGIGTDPVAYGDETVTQESPQWDVAEGWAKPNWWRDAWTNPQDWVGKAPDVPQNPMQTWYRDPNWGGHIAWHPDWGFQDWTDVGNQVYHTGGWEQNYADFTQNMQNAGFTNQQGTWQQYFPDRIDDGSGGNTGTTGGDMGGWDWTKILTGGMPGNPGGMDPGAGGGGDYYGQLGDPAFPYPQEWNNASNVLTRFAMGMPGQIPDAWSRGESYAGQMAESGMPTTYAPWYEKAKESIGYDVQDSINQAIEQAGLGGLRQSSVLGRQAADIGSRRMAELGTQYAGLEAGAQEAARGRQMQGIDQLYQFGGGEAGLAEASANRGLTAAGMLPGLGEMYMNAPSDLASKAMGMSGAMQGMEQSGYDKLYNEFLRGTAENSPWWNLGMGLTSLGGQMQPQQFNPSGGSNLWSTIGTILPLIFSALYTGD